MLISFSVTNYRSFGEEVTLNMVAVNRITDHAHHRIPIGSTGNFVVRTALLYGANASGKSNLVKAMAFAQRLIEWNDQESFPNVDNFRFSKGSGNEPSSFEFRFLVDDHVFVYGFDVTSRGILAEWLSLVVGTDELVVFERDRDGNTKSESKSQERLKDAVLKRTLKVLAALPVHPHQLFLNRIHSLPESAQGTTLSAVLRWLTEELEILQPEHRSCDMLDRLGSDASFREFCASFLRMVDTGINALKLQELTRECRDWERNYLTHMYTGESPAYAMFGCTGDRDIRLDPENSSRLVERTLLAEHGDSDNVYRLPFSEESDGTQQLLHFLPILSVPKDQSKVVVIDELDRSLHPLLCWEFIRFFSDSCPGARRQMIVTTHEAHLLNQDLLRRDEYWFVEKDKNQQSQLVPLSDFNIRNDLQVRKGYLNGRFGAIPIFGAVNEAMQLLNCQANEVTDAKEEAPD